MNDDESRRREDRQTRDTGARPQTLRSVAAVGAVYVTVRVRQYMQYTGATPRSPSVSLGAARAVSWPCAHAAAAPVGGGSPLHASIARYARWPRPRCRPRQHTGAARTARAPQHASLPLHKQHQPCGPFHVPQPFAHEPPAAEPHPSPQRRAPETRPSRFVPPDLRARVSRAPSAICTRTARAPSRDVFSARCTRPPHDLIKHIAADGATPTRRASHTPAFRARASPCPSRHRLGRRARRGGQLGTPVPPCSRAIATSPEHGTAREPPRVRAGRAHARDPRALRTARRACPRVTSAMPPAVGPPDVQPATHPHVHAHTSRALRLRVFRAFDRLLRVRVPQTWRMSPISGTPSRPRRARSRALHLRPATARAFISRTHAPTLPFSGCSTVRNFMSFADVSAQGIGLRNGHAALPWLHIWLVSQMMDDLKSCCWSPESAGVADPPPASTLAC
jgi:hypothetical protein